MDKFLQRHKVLKLIQDKTENVNRLITSRDWTSNLKTIQKEKSKPS